MRELPFTDKRSAMMPHGPWTASQCYKQCLQFPPCVACQHPAFIITSSCHGLNRYVWNMYRAIPIRGLGVVEVRRICRSLMQGNQPRSKHILSLALHPSQALCGCWIRVEEALFHHHSRLRKSNLLRSGEFLCTPKSLRIAA